MTKYFLKADGERDWREVSADEYVRAERNAGFAPKNIDVRDPDYRRVPATASFSSSRAGISGRTGF